MLAREADAVLGRGQLFLQGQEVLVRLQVGIGFGDGEQRLARAGELVLGRGVLADGLGAHRLVAGLDDAFERLLLVGGVALDRLDEVGDQVVAALELHVDLRPGVLRLDRAADQAVVEPMITNRITSTPTPMTIHERIHGVPSDERRCLGTGSVLIAERAAPDFRPA